MVGQPLVDHKQSVRCLAVSMDGTRIVSGADNGTIRVWNAEKRSGTMAACPPRRLRYMRL